MLPKVIFQDLGRISYHKAWDYQFQILKQVIDNKLAIKNLESHPSVSFQENLISEQKSYLLFCEHNHVYTLGKSGSVDHLLLNEEQLTAQNIEFFKINRGGDITYHGEGQITGYPIFDMECFFTDVHRYVRALEDVIIRTIAEYGLTGYRIREYTGVWVEGNTSFLPSVSSDKKRKICAIGVHLSRWVTMHGFAFNVNTDLNYYNNIVPCGIEDADKTVTSLSYELGRVIDVNEVKDKLKRHFKDVFGFEFV
jgi:lipoyl(octanoyl) transferase